MSLQKRLDSVLKGIGIFLLVLLGVWFLLALALSAFLDDVPPSTSQIEECFESRVPVHNRNSLVYVDAMYRLCRDAGTITAAEQGARYSAMIIAVSVIGSFIWILFQIFFGSDTESGKYIKVARSKQKFFKKFLSKTWKRRSSELTAGATSLEEELDMLASFRAQCTMPDSDYWEVSYSKYHIFKTFLENVMDNESVKKSEIVRMQSMLKNLNGCYLFFDTKEVLDGIEWVVQQMDAIYDTQSTLYEDRRKALLSYKADIESYLNRLGK